MTKYLTAFLFLLKTTSAQWTTMDQWQSDVMCDITQTPVMRTDQVESLDDCIDQCRANAGGG